VCPGRIETDRTIVRTDVKASCCSQFVRILGPTVFTLQAMADDLKPFHNPFGVLAPLRGPVPSEERPEPAPVSAEVAAARPARAVVRMERAGRGGKAVTVIEHLGLSPIDLASWLKALKAALGCGGAVDGDAIVLQGDQRKRVVALLAERGVKRVTTG
jgi:translation initiation factor 1